MLRQAVGRPVLDYARDRLFTPLGIDTSTAPDMVARPDQLHIHDGAGFVWPVDPQGVHLGSGGQKLTATDLAELGRLWLQRGRWNGQLVPAGWLATATSRHVTPPDGGHPLAVRSRAPDDQHVGSSGGSPGTDRRPVTAYGQNAGVDLLRYAAFSDSPAAGNPAGVVLDAAGLTDAEMLAAAAEIGYSETAFLLGRDAAGYDIRYFSPLAEVPFCGHATVATAVALAERDGPGPIRLRTRSGVVPVTTAPDGDGRLVATLTSVDAHSAPADDADVQEALAALEWAPADLDPALPPHVAYAGAFHLVLATATRDRLAALSYDFDRLAALMAARGWTTLQLVWRQDAAVFQSRNPFPVGGVVEDPATGAAAAALGGYLRQLGAIRPPAAFTVFQGVDLGRPGRLDVLVPADSAGIQVRGTAVRIP